MSKPTKDELWKSIIEDLFEDFMDYFFPYHIHLIDFEKGYTFLDKELLTILPDSKNKNRRADKLVKVWLKNGEEKWILIHIEVQGYTDDTFGFRVYSSHYRIRDKYGKPVAVFIIYTDESSLFHPVEFREECLGTLSLLQFPTYKVLDHPPSVAIDSDTNNPFAIVMEVVWYEIRKNRLSDENLLETAKKIVWKLARAGFERKTIQKVLQFIKYYAPFEKKEFFHKFEEEIYIVLENKKDMGILELVTKYEKENIREEGKIEGKEEGKEMVFMVAQLHNEGKSSEEISKQLNISQEEVIKILNKLGLK